MKKIYSVILVLALVPLLFGGCGDTGPVGPPGPQGPPVIRQPIKVLLAGYDTRNAMIEMVRLAFKESLFPLGTEIHFASLMDSVPGLETFLEYDATFCWTAGTPAYPDSIGDVLADYVDMGGGLVLAQGAYTISNLGPIGGRIMTEGYSPLIPGPPSADNNPHVLEPNSIALPMHPMFNGTNVDNFHLFHQPQFSNPTMDATATLLALDEMGVIVTAINAAENVVGINTVGQWSFNPQLYPEPRKFMANALMFVGGAFESR